jgi:hypothetical protein
MTKLPVRLSLATALLTTLWGCGIGYNRMLFVTKTNVGFEVDTMPPSLQLSIGRLEGVFAPQFQGGKKLPVLASFKFENEKTFSPFIGSAFATGDAAIALSSLYADKTPPGDWQNRLKMIGGSDQAGQQIDSALTLDEKPAISSWFGTLFEDGNFQGNDVRPVLFGTDTSLGLKVAWSGLTAYVPDTARLGYARKELAWVPITMQETTRQGSAKKEFKIKTSSLLATLDSGLSDVKIESGQPSARFSYVQYFASGDAATLLAMQQTVRQAMLARLDPHAKARAAEFAPGLTGEPKIQAMVHLSLVYQFLAQQADKGDKQADALAKALVPIGQLPPQSYTSYNWNTKVTPPQLSWTRMSLPPRDQRTFSHAMQFWGDMDLSRNQLQAIANQLKEDPKFAFNELPDKATSPVDVTPERKAQLMVEFAEIAEAFAKFDQELRRKPAVIEATTYFVNTIMTSE